MLLRNSELDRRLNCPGSFVDDEELAYDEQNEMARSGTAGHYALALAVDDDWQDIGAYAMAAADKFGVDFEDMRRVVYLGLAVWKDVAGHFERPSTEYRVTGRVSRGTADLVNIQANALAVLDWKTGYGMVEHPNQLLGYADGLVEAFGMPERGYVFGVEAWIRFGTYRPYRITQARLDQFKKEVERAGRHRTFSAGPWCSFCPRRTDCKARNQLARSAVDTLVPVGGGEIVVTPEDIGNVWEKRGLVKKAVDDLEKLAKQLLREGVEINLPDGRKLGLAEQSRRTFDPVKTYDVLTGDDFDMTHDAALEALSATAKGINDIVGQYADKDMKAKDRVRAMKMIDDAGGVTATTSHRLSILDADKGGAS